MNQIQSDSYQRDASLSIVLASWVLMPKSFLPCQKRQNEAYTGGWAGVTSSNVNYALTFPKIAVCAILGKGTDLLDDLRYGMYLGSEEDAQTCLRRLKGERHREKPQVKFLLKSQDIKETALRVLNDFGEREPAVILGSTRGKSRPSRNIAIYVLAHLGSSPGSVQQ